MNPLLATMQSLRELFDTKVKEFADEVDNVHMVWLDEIQQEAVRMFSSDYSAEPELMPKTPSQKKSNRRKRVSVGRADNRGKRRFSRGTRSNLRSSTHVVQTLGLIAENVTVLGPGTSPDTEVERPKRATRRNKQQQQVSMGTEVAGNASNKGTCQEVGKEPPAEPGVPHDTGPQEPEAGAEVESVSSIPLPPAASPPQLVVTVSAAERNSADRLLAQVESSVQVAPKTGVAQESISSAAPRRSASRRVSVRCSLSGLRRSMTQEAVRRASRRSFLKKRALLSGSSGEAYLDTDGEEAAAQVDGVLTEEPAEEVMEPEVKVVVIEEEAKREVPRYTRSMARTNTPLSPPVPPSNSDSDNGGKSPPATTSNSGSKRLACSTEDLASPKKKPSPPIKSQTVIRPNMRSFLHTVQKNQMLMSTPGSLGRNAVIKSFIKHSTPLRVDMKPGSGLVERERLRLETLKKKQEQELERKKKLEEEKKRKQEEMKRKRDERLRKVVEARVKEEQKEEEKKKKIELKMAQMEEKNDKMKVERMAEEKAKKKVASKRQEELELRRKLQEDEATRKKMQQEEEERRQLELQVKRRAEEELERARKVAEVRRARELEKERERERERELRKEQERELRKEQERQRELERERELRKEQERQRELEREREREREKERLRQQQAAAERERIEREKAEALRREVELAAREKERMEAEERSRKEAQERRKAEEEKAALQKQAAAKSKEELQQSLLKTPVGKGSILNVTVEKSPQSYEITPKGGNKPVINGNPEDYGMDQNSDDSTDDESAPRKPIPSWAEGRQLQQAMLQQYFNPVDVDSYFGEIEDPQLERIFYKSKPRYFKRTSSAVWHSPPQAGAAAF